MKFLLTLLFGLCFVLAAIGQGTVNFANFVREDAGNFLVNAPVFDVAGVTRLEGLRFLAQLYAGPEGTRDEGLQAVGDPVPFQTGALAGFWEPAIRVVPGIPPGAVAVVQARAWDSLGGSTFEEAKRVGAAAGSNPISVILGGDGRAPADMIRLQAFTVPVIPEPPTLALSFLGITLLFLLLKRSPNAGSAGRRALPNSASRAEATREKAGKVDP